MMSRFVLVCGLLAAMVVTNTVWAEGPVVGKVSDLTGKAWLIPAGVAEKDKKVVALDQEVREGDTLRTDAASSVKVDFKDKSIIKIGEKSRCMIRKKSAKPGAPTKLHLFTGKIRVKVKSDRVARGLFEVSTPTAVAGVRGTDFMEETKAKFTVVVVFSGRVMVTNMFKEAGGSVMVPSKHKTRVEPKKAPTAPIRVKPEELKKLKQGLSITKTAAQKGKEKKVAEKKKKERKRGEKKVRGETATTEPATEPTTETTPSSEVVDSEALEAMTVETSADVMTEEVQEIVQEEVQEVSAERLPDPPGPPSE